MYSLLLLFSLLLALIRIECYFMALILVKSSGFRNFTERHFWRIIVIYAPVFFHILLFSYLFSFSHLTPVRRYALPRKCFFLKPKSRCRSCNDQNLHPLCFRTLAGCFSSISLFHSPSDSSASSAPPVRQRLPHSIL